MKLMQITEVAKHIEVSRIKVNDFLRLDKIMNLMKTYLQILSARYTNIPYQIFDFICSG